METPNGCDETHGMAREFVVSGERQVAAGRSTTIKPVPRSKGAGGDKGFAMTAIDRQLMELLKTLPTNRVAEVVDFVEFLAAREGRAAAAQRLTEGLARLDALNLPPVSDDEIEVEVQAARRERRDGRRQHRPPCLPWWPPIPTTTMCWPPHWPAVPTSSLRATSGIRRRSAATRASPSSLRARRL